MMTAPWTTRIALARALPVALLFAIVFGGGAAILLTLFDNVFGYFISGFHRHGQTHYETIVFTFVAGIVGGRATAAPPISLRQFTIGALVAFLPTVFLVSALSMWSLEPPPVLETAVIEACKNHLHTSLCGPAFAVITYAKIVRAAPALATLTPLLWWASAQAYRISGGPRQ